MMHLDQKFPKNKLFPDKMLDEIVNDLAFEDSLHHDLRRLTFRYIIPHKLGKKDLKKLSFKASYKGTINGKEDEHKDRELLFWKNHYKNGITDDEVIESANKFKEIFSKFDNQLQKYKYLKGHEFTIVDLAWYVSTKRLSTAGIPINKYENVKRWFDDLENDKRFSNEIKIDGPIVLFKQILKIKNKMMGKYLTDLVKF
jgi:glutathione S-transferase